MTWKDRGWSCRVSFGYDGDGMRLWKREYLPRPLGVVVRLTLYVGYGFEEGYVEALVPHEAGEMVVPGDVCGKVMGVTERGFTGQRQEISFGLYDYNARYMSPALGRFVSPDTIVPDLSNPQAWNRYAYVANNPLKFVDPSGHCWGFASGLRNTFLATTCGNFDLAGAIIASPDASLGEKALAGGYIALSGAATTGAAVGGTILAGKAAIASVPYLVTGGSQAAVFSQTPAGQRMIDGVEGAIEGCLENCTPGNVAMSAATELLMGEAASGGLRVRTEVKAGANIWKVGNRSVSDVVGNTNVTPSALGSVLQLKVEQYAETMAKGNFNWDTMSDPMKFIRNPDGSLSIEEGHHRFIAAQMTNTPIPWNNSQAVVINDWGLEWPMRDVWTNIRFIK